MSTILKEITTTSCPECGCKSVEQYTVKSLHTNGHWNESIKFTCGYNETFSPNFMKVIVDAGSCLWSEKSKQLKLSKDKELQKLLKYASKLKLDEKILAKIKREIEYLI